MSAPIESPFTAPLPGAARDVAVFGEAMTMFIASETGPLEGVETFHRRMAGAEINVAVGLARLGLRVAWASRLGADSLGRYLLAELQKEGVDCSKVVCDPTQRTGFLFKGRVDDGSDPPIEYHRRGSAASLMGPDDVDPAWMQATRHLHATGVFAAISATSLAAAHRTIDVARAAGRSVSFDPNLRPSLWASTGVMRTEINRLAAKAHAVMPGLAEGRLLTGEQTAEGVAHFYRAAGARLVVVKLGKEGAYYDDADAGTGFVEGFPVAQVIDTVGAGDAFAVGVVSALLEGRSVPDAVRRGSWIGARQVQVRGDSEGLPTRAELHAADL
jgi:2-dehydro-3-deoxygluconokinase